MLFAEWGLAVSFQKLHVSFTDVQVTHTLAGADSGFHWAKRRDTPGEAAIPSQGSIHEFQREIQILTSL